MDEDHVTPEWPIEKIERLRALWAEGLSTGEIAKRMNTSKNAIVGKAHRIHLPARPSPIIRGGAGRAKRPPQPKRVGKKPTLALPASVGVKAIVEGAGKAGHELAQALERAGHEFQKAATTPPVQRALAALGAIGLTRRRPVCAWPIGEPGTKGFRFCDAESQAGSPYCHEHTQVAYVKLRDRREDGTP